MKNFKIKNILICFLFAIIFLSNAVCVYAQGEGVPGSSGTKPLSFVSCTLEDGSSINATQGITTQPRFKIKFDKNVVDMLIWENNSKCFSMTDGNSNVPVVVSKIDDTVDFDNRQIVYMHPSSALQPGKTYYIKLSPNLIAKNGQSTLAGTTDGKGLTISFRTKVQAVQSASKNNNSTSNNAEAANAAQNSNSANSANSTNNSAVNSTGETNKKDSKAVVHNQEAASQNKGIFLNTWIEIGTGIIVVLWISIEIFVRRKKERKEQ